MNTDVILWSIPPLILVIAMLGIRRYSPFNVLRHVAGSIVVFGTLAFSTSGVLEPPVMILLGAIGGTLIGQAYEAENHRAAARRRRVGLDDDRSMVVARDG